MDENRIDGAVKERVGQAQDAFGAESGDIGLRARGKLNQAQGAAQNLYGRAADQARDLYGDAVDQAQGLVDQAKDRIADKPFAAAGIAALAGLFIGMAMAGRGRKVVYVTKDR